MSGDPDPFEKRIAAEKAAMTMTEAKPAD